LLQFKRKLINSARSRKQTHLRQTNEFSYFTIKKFGKLNLWKWNIDKNQRNCYIDRSCPLHIFKHQIKLQNKMLFNCKNKYISLSICLKVFLNQSERLNCPKSQLSSFLNWPKITFFLLKRIEINMYTKTEKCKVWFCLYQFGEAPKLLFSDEN
jgi:hypothetical protein